jgi:hypothetical protein
MGPTRRPWDQRQVDDNAGGHEPKKGNPRSPPMKRHIEPHYGGMKRPIFAVPCSVNQMFPSGS